MFTRWYVRFGIERPFPWVGLLIGIVVGPALMLLLGWCVLAFVDCDLGGTRP